VKILHLICSVNPAGGGPIEGVKQLAAVNAAAGNQIEIASLDSPAAPFLKEMPLPVHALGPGILKYSYTPRLVPWLRENASRYDIVVVNGIWQYHSFGAWRALRKSSIPYVLFTHGMLDPWFKKEYPLKHLKKLAYWPWAEYRVLRDAQAVLFTCEEERVLARQSFPRLYRCNEIVVNYGTAGFLGNAQAARESFYTRYPGLRGKRIAVFLGRLHVKKGCDLLIRAFAKRLAADQDWHLLMCGPDQSGWKRELEREAERLGIAQQITFAGMVAGELKWGALLASEVFILPSHQENFGIVVAEALSCGLPALISNKVNIWREVEGAGAGIVGEDDLDGACRMLESWLALSSAARATMRERALTCFREQFEIHKAAHTLYDVLNGVVKGGASAAGA
jgi:glycosyltransferase involved in cell wall biosynthesis